MYEGTVYIDTQLIFYNLQKAWTVNFSPLAPKYFTTNIAQQFFKDYSNAQSRTHNQIPPEPRISLKSFGTLIAIHISENRTSEKNSCLDNQNE